MACRTTNQTPQQPLIGMIFTNADPKYAGRLNAKQGGDTVMTMDIRKRKQKWLEKSTRCTTGSCGASQKKRRRKSAHLSSARKKSSLTMMKRNRKRKKNKKNGSKKKAHRGQSVRHRSCWKQGNIKMAVSEDYASCWAQKDLTVTAKQIQALLTAARASGGKDKCQVRLTGIEIGRAHV